jgi:hypothetical protein
MALPTALHAAHPLITEDTATQGTVRMTRIGGGRVCVV